MLYFNIQRTEKYSTARCYSVINDKDKSALLAHHIGPFGLVKPWFSISSSFSFMITTFQQTFSWSKATYINAISVTWIFIILHHYRYDRYHRHHHDHQNHENLSAVSERCQQVLLLYWWPDSTRGKGVRQLYHSRHSQIMAFKVENFFFFFTNFGFCATVLSETDTLRKCVEDNFLFPEKNMKRLFPSVCMWPDKMIHKNKYDTEKGTSDLECKYMFDISEKKLL